MLICYILDSDDKPVGVLNNDFTFTATQDTTTLCKVSFYRDVKHLFVTEFNRRRILKKGDTMQVNLDSGIDFYYLVTKTKEPFKSAQLSVDLFRGIRKIVKKIIHERQARNEFSAWDQQIYTVLFNEEQQPFSGWDT